MEAHLAAWPFERAASDDKLDGLEIRTGSTRCPPLVDVGAGLECRMVNATDLDACQ